MMIQNKGALYCQILTPGIMNQDFDKFDEVHHLKIEAVPHSKLRVIQKSGSSSLDDINDYLMPDNFEFKKGKHHFHYG